MTQVTKQLRHPSPGEISVTGALAALSDPIRLAIVTILARRGECKWSEFEVPVCKSTLSHHMKVLREAGLLHHRREGTRCFVSLRPEVSRTLPGLLDTVLMLVGREKALEEMIETLSRTPTESALKQAAPAA